MLCTFHVQNSTSVIRRVGIIILILLRSHRKFPYNSIFLMAADIAEELAGRILSLYTYPLEIRSHCHMKPLLPMGWRGERGGIVSHS